MGNRLSGVGFYARASPRGCRGGQHPVQHVHACLQAQVGTTDLKGVPEYRQRVCDKGPQVRCCLLNQFRPKAIQSGAKMRLLEPLRDRLRVNPGSVGSIFLESTGSKGEDRVDLRPAKLPQPGRFWFLPDAHVAESGRRFARKNWNSGVLLMTKCRTSGSRKAAPAIIFSDF